MKTRWDVRAKNRDDDVYRIHYTAVPLIRAIRAVLRYMRKYDEVTIRRSRVVGGRR